MSEELTANSTVLSTNDATIALGAGNPGVSQEPEDTSIQGILTAEAAKIRSEAEQAQKSAEDKAKADEAAPKVDAKASEKAPEKEAPKDETKEASKEVAKEPVKEPVKADEQTKRYADPPKKFLPEARTKWANVPNEIKAEFHRVSEDHEREIAEYRQYREELREYDEMAKSYGTTLKDTLSRYRAAEQALEQNFGAGVAMIAQQNGMTPAQAIAHVMQGYGISPQQYIQAVQNNPSLAQPQMAPQIQRPQQPMHQQAVDPETLKSQILMEVRQEIQKEIEIEQNKPLVREFAASHPDFYEISDKIMEILDMGWVDTLYGNSLSLEQKLAEAYRIAGGRGSSSIGTAAAAAHSEPEARLGNPDAGKKSVRGAPANGFDPASEEEDTDLQGTLRKELRKIRAA